jgi:hypothetical protein
MLAAIPLDEPNPTANAVILSETQRSEEQAKNPEGSSPTTTADSISTTDPRLTPLSPILYPLSSSPEDRTRNLLTSLEEATQTPATLDETCDALSLFRRWYYRPEKQRTGEVFLPNPDGGWPIRRILNGAARVVLGPPAPVAPVDREAAKVLKTKILHAGREGVEREVPVLPKRSRTRKAVTPTDILT